MQENVWVFAEQHEGSLADVSLELLGEGRKLASRLGTGLAAVLLGHEVQEAARILLDHGADRVYLADSAVLEPYQVEPYALVLRDLIATHSPEVLLMGATSLGYDLAPRLAAKLGTGLSADCTALEIDDRGLLVQVVPAFGGKVMARIVCPQRRPQMATVRPGVMKPAARVPATGVVQPVEVGIRPEDLRTKVLQVTPVPVEVGGQLNDAEVVVAGGYGVGNKDGWKLIAALASALKGAVGATRPVVDEGWAPEGQMIGQSGRVVHPKLYIGVGISGAMQHMVGVRDSTTIVAINQDPKAAIFAEADYRIIGDLREILPALTKEIQTITESGSSTVDGHKGPA